MRPRCSLPTCGRPAYTGDPLCLGHKNLRDKWNVEPIDDDELADLWVAGALYVTDAPADYNEALMEALDNTD